MLGRAIKAKEGCKQRRDSCYCKCYHKYHCLVEEVVSTVSKENSVLSLLARQDLLVDEWQAVCMFCVADGVSERQSK